MIEPCAEQAGSFEVEKSGDFVGDEGEESVDEEEDDEHPFEEGVDQEIGESSVFFLDRDPQFSSGKHGFGRKKEESLRNFD